MLIYILFKPPLKREHSDSSDVNLLFNILLRHHGRNCHFGVCVFFFKYLAPSPFNHKSYFIKTVGTYKLQIFKI